MADERGEYQHDNHWFVLILAGVYMGVERTESKRDEERALVAHVYILSEHAHVYAACTCMSVRLTVSRNDRGRAKRGEWSREKEREGEVGRKGGNCREKKGEFSPWNIPQ